MPYPKRLIEVDLPIKRISVHARREKSIRHGHISTLHIWWARRPLAACRAVLCASLWPDPADEYCSDDFIEFAKKEMLRWSDNDHLLLLSKESVEHFITVNHNNNLINNKLLLRQLLLDFIADFANWDNSNNEEFLRSSKRLTQKAYVALGGDESTMPMMVDPFAGGGAIPLEGSRIGCEVFASDLNPIAVLLNKAHLDIIPSYGPDLKEKFIEAANWIYEKANKKLSKYYKGLTSADRSTYIPEIEINVKKDNIIWKLDSVELEKPTAYLWARVIKCEGPGCGIKIPLLRTNQIVKKAKKNIFIDIGLTKDRKEITTKLVTEERKGGFSSTVKKGSAICPRCGYVTKGSSVRNQLKSENGGANESRLIAVVTNLITTRKSNKIVRDFEESGKYYRDPTVGDLSCFKEIRKEFSIISKETIGDYPLIPNEPTPEGKGGGASRAFSQRNYGIDLFSHAYTNRQLLTLTTFAKEIYDSKFDESIKVFLGFALGRVNDLSMTLCRWLPSLEAIAAANGGQNRMPVPLDFAESNPIGESGGNWLGQVEWIARVIQNLTEAKLSKGTIIQNPAQEAFLPDESVDILFTDPPYYDAFPYSDLSDFFFIWLKRCLGKHQFSNNVDLVPKEKEIVVYDIEHGDTGVIKDNQYFADEMTKVFSTWRVASKFNSVAVVVFANKTLLGWESMLKGLVDSGWIITASWPIDTERENRQRAQNSAALSTSVHLVCRPREHNDGSLIQNQIGDWRDVQEELPRRINEWMPRLREEGVVGADAIFACLGPALEVFSRYTKVVQAGSEREIKLREYLEKVWAAVSQEALNMVFSGGDAKSLEEDARLTAMWLWTLAGGGSENSDGEESEIIDEDDDNIASSKSAGGYGLPADTASRIAQGLGVDLNELKSLIEVKGDKARLLSVEERVNVLFGSTGIQQQATKKKKKSQLSLTFENSETQEDVKYEMPELIVEQAGKTVLDRLHQAMLLFSTGRTEALKRFLVEDGAGKDDRFWKLAQSLTALYPKDTDERRWVEAVQTYKKSLGF